jgi:uncharacterized protein (DUF2252 family)
MTEPTKSGGRRVATSHADPAPPRIPRRAIEGDTAAKHRAYGRSIRLEVPLSAHGDWTSPPDRPDPVALLMEQSATRVEDLVPIRYGRMLVSPFTFLRGAALPMAADLARLPSSGIYVQACGDAHLSNFGVFATPERRLSFDVNDFDETHPAPFEWDIKRLAASIVVAALGADYPEPTARRITRAAVEAYRTEMRKLAAMTFLEAWYERIDVTAMLQEIEQRGSARQKKVAKRAVEKASTETNLGSLGRLAQRTDAGWRIREDPPLIVRFHGTPAQDAALREGFKAYRRSLGRDMQPVFDAYRAVDWARKVVGVGSIGTQAFIFLNIGLRNGDAVFLQVKEAQPSVLSRYTEVSTVKQNGERVVTGQRIMQAASDRFLGWVRIDGLGRPYDFYVRQLRDWKMSYEVGSGQEKRFATYARFCALALARAHARSGSASAIAGYLGKGDTFDRAIESFAVTYADQNERDYQALQQAEADGRIEVRHGV